LRRSGARSPGEQSMSLLPGERLSQQP
jgi:hypothetical protein